MGLFNRLFSKDSHIPSLPDFSLIGTDIHSHLISGIDDGSKSLEESMELIRGLYNLGYRKLVTTPHIMSDYYQNTPEGIKSGLHILHESLELNKIPIKIEAAAEYYLDYNLQSRIDNEKLLTIGNNYVLFELSYFNPPNGIKDVIFKLQTNGYKPILAHPERYLYWHNDFTILKELKDREVYFQLNINSFTGEYSIPTKKVAEKLITENMIEFLGTDTHNMHHIELLNKALKNKILSNFISSGKLLNNTI